MFSTIKIEIILFYNRCNIWANIRTFKRIQLGTAAIHRFGLNKVNSFHTFRRFSLSFGNCLFCKHFWPVWESYIKSLNNNYFSIFKTYFSCWRGDRLYDNESDKIIVLRWVQFFKVIMTCILQSFFSFFLLFLRWYWQNFFYFK